MSLAKSDGMIVAADVELANTYIKRVVGLMFRKSLDGALVFDMGRETYDGIHMLFVRFPIDVLFLDAEKKIVDAKARVRPWVGTAFPRSWFRYAVELPAGSVEKFSLDVGERLVW
jgi:uncharacterized membrane protein (UPF0127 family)